VNDVDNLVVRFDNRDGFKMVDYEVVGLPVWRLGLILQNLEETSIAATEEFALRLIKEGFNSVDDIGALLGLDREVVKSVAGDLVGMDAVVVQDGKLTLTKMGEDLRRTALLTKPSENVVQIHYDAILKRPEVFRPYQLFTPRELKEEGSMQINPRPNRRPEPGELGREDVEAYINEAVKGARSTRVIRIKDVTSRRVLYQKAIMLVFKANYGDDVQVGFVIDRRLSEEHEIEFAKSDGLRRMGIGEAVRERGLRPEESLLGKADARRLDQEARMSAKDASDLKIELSEIKEKIQEKEEQNTEEGADVGNDAAAKVIRGLMSEKNSLEKRLNEIRVHQVSVYEHPDYLRNAFETAENRILVISPWITRAVVDKRFIDLIRGRLKSGVDIFIGYGLDEREDESPIATSAEMDLIEESKQNKGLCMRRLGDTHAKVLIKDDEYMITTSFNWLSFRGNPNRRFREEWGTFIGIREMIDKQFEWFKKRILGRGEE